MECELRPLNRADGSARFNFSRTSVLAGVFGPREGKASQKASQIGTDESVLVVNFGAQGAVGSQWDRSSEVVMRECLEAMVVRSQNPMCVIEVTLQPMCDDGSQLAASFNAAVAALIDAGVALRFVAVGVCCALVRDGTLLLDPTKEEEEAALAVQTFVIRPTDGHIVTSVCSGPMTEQAYMLSLDLATQSAITVKTFIRMALERRISNEQMCWGAHAY
eukprot:Tamp_22671.p1 GENE.Tamp_22671~~Tamp_22671.p1  ORF type:complete len:240 (+),score=30.47 Tamp_22671:64-720(+)